MYSGHREKIKVGNDCFKKYNKENHKKAEIFEQLHDIWSSYSMQYCIVYVSLSATKPCWFVEQ